MIRLYDSPAAFAAHAKECGTSSHSRCESFAGAAWDKLAPMLANGGDESDVPAARKLLERFELELPETERAEFIPSVAGVYPCVPDAISGLPESMRTKAYVPNTGAPIRLGIITTVSGSIDIDAFRKKSAAMLAILMHLSNTGRALELYGISTIYGKDKDGETVMAYRIPSAPLSIAECNMALGNLAFARRLAFDVSTKTNGFEGSWPRGFDCKDGGTEYAAKLAKRMGFQMILPALSKSESKDIKTDPAKWMLTKYAAIQAQIDLGVTD